MELLDYIVGFVLGYGACLALDALVARRRRPRPLRGDAAPRGAVGAPLGALGAAWSDPAGVCPLRRDDARVGCGPGLVDVHTREHRAWLDSLQRDLATRSWREE